MGSIIRWVVFHTSRASVINFHPNYSFEVGKTSVQTPLEWYKDDRQRPSSFLQNWYDFFRTPWSHWLGGTEGDVTNWKELMKGKVNFRLALQLSSGGGLKNFWQVVSFRNTVFFLFWQTSFTTSDCGFDENGPFLLSQLLQNWKQLGLWWRNGESSSIISRPTEINFDPNSSFKVGKTSVQTPSEWDKDDRQRPSSFLQNWYDFFRTPWSHWLGGTEGDVTNLKELMKGKLDFRLACLLFNFPLVAGRAKLTSCFCYTVRFLYFLS